MSLEPVIKSLIDDAPPGDKSSIIKDLNDILSSNSSAVVNKLIKEFYLTKDYKLVPYNEEEANYLILSNINQDGLKFIDYNNQIKYDYDFKNNNLIDIEQGMVTGDDDELLIELNKNLKSYMNDHYPNDTKSCIAVKDETSSVYKLLIINEFLNDSNYYNGKWISEYTYNATTKTLEGQLKVKIHYYEDGNVILKINKKLSSVNNVSNLSSLIKEISKFEDENELLILKEFSKLNENLFKNLRRLLPINKSKIKWGVSIGNYKLGQDVVNN